MKYQEQWEQFEEAGKVADYLAYCRQAGQMSAGNMMDGSALGMALAENVMWSGSVRNAGEGDWDRGDNGTPQEVAKHAGDDNGDGNDLTDITAERVR